MCKSCANHVQIISKSCANHVQIISKSCVNHRQIMHNMLFHKILDSLLGVNFDLKPLESKMDQRIKVRLEPIQIVYDAVSQPVFTSLRRVSFAICLCPISPHHTLPPIHPHRTQWMPSLECSCCPKKSGFKSTSPVSPPPPPLN